MDAVVPKKCDHPSRGQDGPAQENCQDVGRSGLLLQHFEAQVSLAILALGLPAGADSQETEKCHPGTRPVSLLRVQLQGTVLWSSGRVKKSTDLATSIGWRVSLWPADEFCT